MKPTVSAFIINYNTCALLEKCLRSLYERKGNITIEVFVADNNSDDGSPEMVEAKFPQVHLTRHSENLGYTKALNPLLPLGKGNYYLFLHPDVEVLPNTLGDLVAFLESHPKVGIAGANLYYPDGTPNPCEVLWPGFENDLVCFVVRLVGKIGGVRRVLDHFNPMQWSHNSTCQVASVWNACMMVRRDVLEKVGYFDENFFYGSVDWDLCKRAAETGWAVYYVHSAIAVHYERQSFDEKDTIRDDVRYKVDGWPTAVGRYHDRFVFLKKHGSQASIYGAKAIYVLENTLRLPLILASFLLGRVSYDKASFQFKAWRETMQAILKA